MDQICFEQFPYDGVLLKIDPPSSLGCSRKRLLPKYTENADLVNNAVSKRYHNPNRNLYPNPKWL